MNNAQSNPPQSGEKAQSQTSNPSASRQSANPPANANTNQAQQGSSGNANQAQQNTGAATSNQAQREQGASGSAQGAGSVKLTEHQRTRVSEAVSKLNVRPVTNLNFSLSVGTVVPKNVQLSTLPPDVAEIVPEYRGYSFALVKDELVIVDPSTYEIVTVLPYSGRSTASAPAPARERSKFTLTDRDREIIRKHTKARVEGRTVEGRTTTGSTVRRDIRMGERVPESVEIEEFPAEVYHDVPTLREYRYLKRDDRTYIVEPHDRTVIEEIE